ncbi:hypothetical protein LTR53_018844, partial [Teratosphaeriaceae sp. CCFEE 6253]
MPGHYTDQLLPPMQAHHSYDSGAMPSVPRTYHGMVDFSNGVAGVEHVTQAQMLDAMHAVSGNRMQVPANALNDFHSMMGSINHSHHASFEHIDNAIHKVDNDMQVQYSTHGDLQLDTNLHGAAHATSNHTSTSLSPSSDVYGRTGITPFLAQTGFGDSTSLHTSSFDSGCID